MWEASRFFDTASFFHVFTSFRKYWKILGNRENCSAENLALLLPKISCIESCCLSPLPTCLMKQAGSSWLGNEGRWGEKLGYVGRWCDISVGGSPSLNRSRASGKPGVRGRMGERKKEGAKSFCQCHLVGRVQMHEPEHWWLGKKRGILSGAGRSACMLFWGGSAPLAAFAGGSGESLSGQPSSHPLHLPGWVSVESCSVSGRSRQAGIALSSGASREGVRCSRCTLPFLKGWG